MPYHVNTRITEIFRLNFAGNVRHNVTSLKNPDLSDLLMLQKNPLKVIIFIQASSQAVHKYPFNCIDQVTRWRSWYRIVLSQNVRWRTEAKITQWERKKKNTLRRNSFVSGNRFKTNLLALGLLDWQQLSPCDSLMPHFLILMWDNFSFVNLCWQRWCM